ncbi:hypothetical protein DRW07_13200 [Alteromonas sediminis]|uniref:Uncharacterized protein n=1 Tax=Alteromonas sediminis TaxID=2259342 RepID=A0A3N5XXL7_9ALTE|nr:hypothetical protein [Alteromonas sediminis]RPJ65767.1 hypothetical protein DRW07_13200 [Alteromonas sediminis]
MQFLTRYLPPFLFTWILTFTLASVLHSQFVVNELVNVGVKIRLLDRLSLTIDDWVGLLPTYGVIIAIGLLLAFIVVGFIIKKAPEKRFILFLCAGAAAFAVLLSAMQPIMQITIIAGAREAGFYAQILAGAIGGALFAKLTAKKQ